jgi:myo-inositol-1(or 4)-monophosphatase
MSNFSANITVMMRAAEKAAKSLLRDFGEIEQLQVSRKGPGDFVSLADKRAEDLIYNELRKSRPSFGFLMEESGEIKGEDGEYRFIIDPLDGTNNFLHAIPHWSINIALERGSEIIAALTFDPIRNETFIAEKGTGAFLENKKLRVSARQDLGYAVIGGGDAVRREGDVKDKLYRSVRKLTDVTSGYRRMGSAALDLAYVAAGRFEGFWETGLKPWDAAAGILLIREAGGIVVSLSGDTNPVYATTLLATNSLMHQQIKALIEV